MSRIELKAGFAASAVVIAIAFAGTPEWGVSLLAAGLGAAVFACIASFAQGRSTSERVAVYAALLLCSYGVLQLIPLPQATLRVIDPTRAEIADALQRVIPNIKFSSLTVDQSKTCLRLSWIVAQVLVFLLIREVTRRTNGGWMVALPLLVLGGFEAMLGIIQNGTAGASVIGTSDNRDHFSCLLEMTLPFAMMYGISFVRFERPGPTSWDATRAGFFLVLATAMAIAVMFTLSKMGFAAMAGSLFAAGALVMVPGFAGRKRWLGIVGLAALTLVLIFVVPTNGLMNAMGGVSSDPTAEGRIPIAKDTLHLISAYPLFGSGLGTFFTAFLRYQTHAVNLAWLSSHNDYLDFASELGAIGFLFLAAFVGAALWCGVRAAVSGTTREIRLLGAACVGGLVATLIHGFAEFNMMIPANAMLFAWIAGIAVALPSASTETQPRSVKTYGVRGFLLVAGCLVGLYGAGWLVFLHSFQGDQGAERVFSRFGIWDSSGGLNIVRSQYGGDIASVPPPKILEYLRRDPAGSYLWEDLGESLQRAGRINEARDCFERAIKLAPQIPSVLSRAARFFFRQGDKTRGLDLTRRILERSPEQLDFDYYPEAITVEEVLRSLPADPLAWRSHFRSLIAGEKPRIDDAITVWKQLVPRGYADEVTANEFARFLIGKKRPEAAVEAWVLYAGSRSPGYPQAERVFNGGFETDPYAQYPAFDWSTGNTPGAAVDFDRDVRHAGARSLRVQFDGTRNLTSAGLSQTVVLKAGRYRFSAWVHSKDLSTDEGVAFNIVGQEGAAPRFTSEAVLGSTDWKRVEGEVVAPPGTSLAVIQLTRKASLKFDNLLKGTLWVDQVSLRPER